MAKKFVNQNVYSSKIFNRVLYGKEIRTRGNEASASERKGLCDWARAARPSALLSRSGSKSRVCARLLLTCSDGDGAERRRMSDPKGERRVRRRESSSTGRWRGRRPDRGPARETRREGDASDGDVDARDGDWRLTIVLLRCAPFKARLECYEPECATLWTPLPALASAAQPAHCHHSEPDTSVRLDLWRRLLAGNSTLASFNIDLRIRALCLDPPPPNSIGPSEHRTAFTRTRQAQSELDPDLRWSWFWVLCKLSFWLSIWLSWTAEFSHTTVS